MLSKHPVLTNLFLCLTFLFIQGCSNNSSIFSKDNLPLVHRIDIQQGNVITQDMLAKLKLGMEKKKVRFIMGTPLITDTFHNDRWDYIYTYQDGRGQREQRRVTLFFEDDRLSQIDGDVVAARGKIQTDSRKVESVEVPPADPPGIFSRVKETLTFGKDKPKSAEKDNEKSGQPIGTDDEQAKLPEETKESTTEDVIDTDSTAVEAGEDSESDKGFFGKMWEKTGDDPEISPNDPTLTDPDLNPDY